MGAGFVGNTSVPTVNSTVPTTPWTARTKECSTNSTSLLSRSSLAASANGGRVDLLYGEDFWLAPSVGLENHDDGSSHWNPQYYGVAIPQAYVEMGSSDLWVKIGHFYSIVGYEGLPAPNSFFYTKSYSYQFAGPFTHWGGLATWTASERWQFQAGLTNGWDTLDREPDDNLNFLGLVKYTGECGGWTSFAIVTGDDISNPGSLPITDALTNRTRYSWLVSLPVGCHTDYVFHQWLGSQEEGAIGGGMAYWSAARRSVPHYQRVLENGFAFESLRDEDRTAWVSIAPAIPTTSPLSATFTRSQPASIGRPPAI